MGVYCFLFFVTSVARKLRARNRKKNARSEKKFAGAWFGANVAILCIEESKAPKVNVATQNVTGFSLHLSQKT